MNAGAEPADLASYSISRLIQHIVRTHHQYVRCELPRLVEMAHKLIGKHGDRAPELKEVEALLDALHAEMFAHLQKEEQVLFPFIAQMEEETVGIASSAHACFQSGRPTGFHDGPGTRISRRPLFEVAQTDERLRAARMGMSHIHRTLCRPSTQFERDLQQHVHLENDILFPRAIEMESALNQRR